MTVSTLTNTVVYRGNGATTEFAVPFKVLDEDHLQVKRRVYNTGVVDYTYIGTDYSYSGIGDSSGTLTLAGDALDDDYELVIERVVPYTQALDIVNAGGFYPETVEEQLDVMTMGIQQVADLADRGAVVPVGENGLTLPKASERAGKFFSFGTMGEFVAASGTGADGALRADLATDGGSELILHTPDDPEGVSSTVSAAIIRGPIYHETYRRVGRTELESLILSFAWLAEQGGGDWKGIKGGEIELLNPAEVDGKWNDEVSILEMVTVGDSEIDFRGCRIGLTTSTAPVNVFYFVDWDRVTLAGLHGFDRSVLGFDNGNQGAKLVVLDANAMSGADRLTVRDVTGGNLNTFLACQGDVSNRVETIRLEGYCAVTLAEYGLLFQNNGDDVSGQLACRNVGRSYFAYGIEGHKLAFDIENDGSGPSVHAGALIKRYSRNTKNIDLDLSFRGTLDDYTIALASIEHANNSGAASIVDDVRLRFHVAHGITDAATPAKRLLFRSFAVDDATENTGNSTHWTKHVTVEGDLGESTAPHIHSNYTATTPSVIDMSGPISGRSLTRTVNAPGFLVQIGPYRYEFEKFGALATGNVSIPVGNHELLNGMLKVTIVAQEKTANTDGAGTKQHRFEDVVSYYVDAGPSSALLTGGVDSIVAVGQNSSGLTRTYAAATGATITITFADDADYGANAYARIEIESLWPLVR